MIFSWGARTVSSTAFPSRTGLRDRKTIKKPALTRTPVMTRTPLIERRSIAVGMFLTPGLQRAGRAEDVTVHHLAVIVQLAFGVEALDSLFEIAAEARILRARVAVYPRRDVPRFLNAQYPGIAEWHIRMNEGGRDVDAVHAGTPIVGIRPPKRRKGVASVQAFFPLAVAAVTHGAVGRVHLPAAAA